MGNVQSVENYLKQILTEDHANTVAKNVENKQNMK